MRFCRLKTDFANEQGIRQPEPTTTRPRFSPTRSRLIPTQTASANLPIQSQSSSVTREGDTLIVTPSRTVSEEDQQSNQQTNLRSTLINRLRNRPRTSDTSSTSNSPSQQNDACKGLRFCRLSPNAGNRYCFCSF